MMQIEVDQDQMDYQEEYEIEDTLVHSDLLTKFYRASDEQLFSIIDQFKQDNAEMMNFFELIRKLDQETAKKFSECFESKIIQHVSKLAAFKRFSEEQKYKDLLQFVETVVARELTLPLSQKFLQTFQEVFEATTEFCDLVFLMKVTRQIIGKNKEILEYIAGYLSNVYHGKLDNISQSKFKFTSAISQLSEEDKLILKVQTIWFLSQTKFSIQENEISKIYEILKEKPYRKLLEKIISKKFRISKEYRHAIMKTKMVEEQGKIKLVFGSKIGLCQQLKNEKTLKECAERCFRAQFIQEVTPDSFLVHKESIYVKWSEDLITQARDKIIYDDGEDIFLNMLNSLKKLFENKSKCLKELSEIDKISEEQNTKPDEKLNEKTARYFCKLFQIFTRYLSFNSMQINRRVHNLNEIILPSFVEELLLFFESCQSDERFKNEVWFNESLSVLMTFMAHLFYRRDYQMITAYTCKVGEILIRILLKMETFPLKWNTLRNFKLLIDRWAETLTEGEDYKKITAKFLSAYFDKNVVVTSKSNSTVFNPIFVTRVYSKIYSSELLNFVKQFEAKLDLALSKDKLFKQGQDKQFDAVVSKIILFMSARLRLQDNAKISEHMCRIYRKYAHILPAIYTFRAWIIQTNISRISQTEIQQKITELRSLDSKIYEQLEKFEIKTLITKGLKLEKEENILKTYEQTHYRCLNILQLKSKNEQYGPSIFKALVDTIELHEQLISNLRTKIFKFIKENKKQAEQIAVYNGLSKTPSFYQRIDSVSIDFKMILRYYLCSHEKLLSVKDHHYLAQALGQWFMEKFKQKQFAAVYVINEILTSTGGRNDSHLQKKQVLGAIRNLNLNDQLNLNKRQEISFNQLSSFCQAIVPAFEDILKMLIKAENSDAKSPIYSAKRYKLWNWIKQIDQLDNAQKCMQHFDSHLLLKYLLAPIINISGSCYFNGKLEEKAKESMALGILYHQIRIIMEVFDMEQLIKLGRILNLSSVFRVLKNKELQIIQVKNHPNQLSRTGNIFAGGRPRSSSAGNVRQQLRRVNIPQQFIEIALQNIDIPDAQIALEWIQNNQDRIEELLVERTINKSKEMSMVQKVVEKGDSQLPIQPINFPEFQENVQKAMKQQVKKLAQSLFSQNGKKIVQILFILLDSFKEEYRKKQYKNFNTKMFTEIDSLNAQSEFNESKFGQIISILIRTMKKQDTLIKEFYLKGINFKVLSYFCKLKDKEVINNLSELIHMTIPAIKQDKQIKPELIEYFHCVLDAILLSKSHDKNNKKILQQISKVNNQEIRKKIVRIFINQLNYKEKIEENSGLLSTAVEDFSFVHLLFSGDKQLFKANIELDIKSFIIEKYKEEVRKSETGQKKYQVIEIDLKKFVLSFDRYETNGKKSFEVVFKELLSRKKNKKNSIFFNTKKHNLFKSQVLDQSFLEYKHNQETIDIVKALLSRLFNQTEQEKQGKYLIDFHKLLECYKILLPLVIELEIDGMNICEWIVSKCLVKRKIIYNFLTLLAMNNGLYLNSAQCLSQLTCFKLLQCIKANKDKKDASVSDKIKSLLQIIYLSQINAFNKMCLLPLFQGKSVLSNLQEQLDPSEPIPFSLQTEAIYILQKRIMVDRLKQKYQILIEKEQTITEKQMLCMNLIYKVDSQDYTQDSINGQRKNSARSRIQFDSYIQDDEQHSGQEEEEQFHNVSNMIRLRFGNGAQSGLNRGGTSNDDDFSFLPTEQIVDQPLPQSVNQGSDGAVSQSQNNVASSQASQQKPEQKAQEKIKQEKAKKVLQPHLQTTSPSIDYKELSMNDAIILQKNLTAIRKSLENLGLNQIMQVQDPVSKEQDSQLAFKNCLVNLIKKSSQIDILGQHITFQGVLIHTPKVNISFSGIKKMSRFEKRFASIITNIYPSIAGLFEQQKSSETLNIGKRLSSRLALGGNPQERAHMINEIQRLINQRYRQQNQQRVRPINLSSAVAELTEEVEPPKQEKRQEKIESKPQQKIEIQPVADKDKTQKIQEEEVVDKEEELIVEQKKSQNIGFQSIEPQKEVEKQQKQEKKHTQTLEKIVQEKTQKEPQKIVEQKPAQSSIPVENIQEKPETTSQQKSQKKEQIQGGTQEIIPQPQGTQEVIPQSQPQQAIIQQPQGTQEVIPQSQPQQAIIQQPQSNQPYREILSMFGLAQTFLTDNGIDPESFYHLPEELQIDQITHYMNQAQTRAMTNPQQSSNQARNAEQGQEGAPQQAEGYPQNTLVDDNIALFASMDPVTRAQTLADCPPEFLQTLPVQMRTEVEQFRQRQIARIIEEEEINERQNVSNAYLSKNQKRKNTKMLRFPQPSEINFKEINEELAVKIAKSILVKIPGIKMFEGFRLLLQNKTTQNKALSTLIGLLKNEDGLDITYCKYQNEEWVTDQVRSEGHDLRILKGNILVLIFETLKNLPYKYEQFLTSSISSENFLQIQIQTIDQSNMLNPLNELLPYSIQLYPDLAVQIIKRTKSLPNYLISKIVQSIRNDKLSTEFYKHLEFLSKNQQMKKQFFEQFPQSRPPKIECFAKIIQYEFAKVSYLRKMHEEALNFYNPEYNEFLNQIFGIYTMQDVKDIESLLLKHKNVHFQVIKHLYSKNRVLDKQPMGLILKVPHLLDFETKKYLFRKHPKIRRSSRYRLPIQVSRDNILQETYNQIMAKTPHELEGRLQVTFMDEQGYDAGGLTRQWLMCVSRQIFRPDYALFEPSSSGNTYQPNPKSYINPDHLQYFKFIGRFVGKALAENQLVDAYFTRAVYKMILGQDIELSDLQQQDYSFYKSMKWLKENPVEQGDYTYSYLYDNFGQRIIKDIIPDGRNINVTQLNKLDYIEKYCLAKMRDDFKVQMEKFLEGFHEIIPAECISFFEAKELQLLISGLPEIDFEDLKANVDYSGYAPTDQIVQWFWEVVGQFSQEDLARLIQFITGTSKIPVDGFGSIKGMNGPQRISIHKDPNQHQLPKAHTCFNQLDLPKYQSKQKLRERIVTAITWGSEGFGFM